MNKIFIFFLVSVLSLFVTGCAQDELKSTVTLDEFQKQAVQNSNSKQEDGKQVDQASNGKEVKDDQPEAGVGELPKTRNDLQVNRDGVQGHVDSQPDYATDTDVQVDYILGPGDLIEVTVFETEDLNTQARVSSRGYVSLPLLNRVNVQGLTSGEAEEKIEKLLRANYLHDPHVTLFIRERISQQITLVGALQRPGAYEFMNSKTIMDMIAVAGGLAVDAGNIAYVSRPASDNKEEKQIYLVDLHQLITKGKVEMNMPIHGGDVIFVPKAGLVHVDGAVHTPGAFKLEPDMTIDQAIAAAGGLQGYADTDDIKLIRQNDNGERNIIQLSMQDIRSSSTKNLLLKSDDVVFVEVSGAKTFFSGFGFNVGFLGTGFSYDSPIE